MKIPIPFRYGVFAIHDTPTFRRVAIFTFKTLKFGVKRRGMGRFMAGFAGAAHQVVKAILATFMWLAFYLSLTFGGMALEACISSMAAFYGK